METADRDVASRFVSRLASELEGLGIDLSPESVDHLCYRVETIERYEEVFRNWSRVASCIAESSVNGRPIATFRLHEPIEAVVPSAKNWEREVRLHVPLLELPAPKPSKAYKEGWEHIEVVTGEPLAELVRRKGDLQWNVSNIDHGVNPDVSVTLKAGTIKFHPTSLESVVQHELLHFQECNRKRAFVFDLDDTLIDTGNMFLEAFTDALEAVCPGRWTPQQVRAAASPTFPECFARLGLEPGALRKNALESFCEHWAKRSRSLRVPAGVETLLRTLRHEQFGLYLWSSRSIETVQTDLETLHWKELFSGVWGFSLESGPGKPVVPESLKQELADKEVVLVGDSSADQEAAARLKAPFVQACWVRGDTLAGAVRARSGTPLEILKHRDDLWLRATGG